MRIKQSEFITSAVKRSQYPVDMRNEIAFVGRSNVGKSSIINALTNRKKLAKVSQTPGKTRLVNFFLINNDFYLVDLPGYGYAKVSKTEKESWGKVIGTYLENREQLKRIVLLVDSRHKPTSDDIMMYDWIKHYGYDAVIVATKSDKLKNSEFKKNEKIIRDTLKIRENDRLYFFSSLNKKNSDALIDNIFADYAQDLD